ncbi:MAG: ISNCY family transposase [Alphaproteobacteria bacterium]|nr:ISNCY family transposase [Alphaproteobacteria bacterium]MCL2504912.1 ISNCY family transposase [Alphaproteobacteria bacterium]
MSVLNLSKSQTFKLLKQYREHGLQSIKHGLCNRLSNNQGNSSVKEQVLGLIRSKYYDFGPTLASEHLLEEEGIQVHPETLRIWMKQAGLAHKTRKRKPYRQRRDRKECFGKMLQIDGSFHHWFGVDKPKACLLNLIDDATSHNLCLFDHEETSYTACIVLWQWIQKYGIPQSIYCDRRNAYISSELSESSGFFGQMCKRLRIQIIPAFSAQAKGRVERSNQTHQDRLVPKMRLHNITTIEAANQYLQRHYLHYHNSRFAKQSASFEDVHSKLPQHTKLDDICYLEETRKVNNDWTIKFRGRTLQITRKNYCPAKSAVMVRYSINGHTDIYYKNEHLSYITLNS